jgi:nickel-dependent lactate racemase
MVIFTNLQTVFHYHFGYDFGQPKIIAPVISSLMFTTEDVESDTLWL